MTATSALPFQLQTRLPVNILVHQIVDDAGGKNEYGAVEDDAFRLWEHRLDWLA